jgi:hypothetical protein
MVNPIVRTPHLTQSSMLHTRLQNDVATWTNTLVLPVDREINLPVIDCQIMYTEIWICSHHYRNMCHFYTHVLCKYHMYYARDQMFSRKSRNWLWMSLKTKISNLYRWKCLTPQFHFSKWHGMQYATVKLWFLIVKRQNINKYYQFAIIFERLYQTTCLNAMLEAGQPRNQEFESWQGQEIFSPP